MATFTDPLAQQQDFRQRRLGSLLSGQGIHPDIAIGPAQPQSDDGQDARQSLYGTGLQNISSSASNQSNLYIQAVQRRAQMDEEARQQKFMQDQLAKIAAARPSGSIPTVFGGSNKASSMGGPWNLTPQATSSLQALSAAYQKKFGTALVVNSGGRSYEQQKKAYDAYLAGRGNLAAPPGTSVHESGRAVDLGGAILNSSSAQHRWLEQNAGAFGWAWTGKNFSQVEPWHWEYVG